MTEPIAPDLLEILVCPETHQALHLADAALLARVRERQAAGTLLARSGHPVTEAPDALLVREDGHVAYAIIDHIPIMLIDLAIDLDQAALH